VLYFVAPSIQWTQPLLKPKHPIRAVNSLEGGAYTAMSMARTDLIWGVVQLVIVLLAVRWRRENVTRGRLQWRRRPA